MTYRQDPADKAHYELLLENDTVAASTWTVVPAIGATIGSPTSFTEGNGGGSRVLFGTATAGVYTLTCNIQATSGQIFERSFLVKVEELF